MIFLGTDFLCLITICLAGMSCILKGLRNRLTLLLLYIAVLFLCSMISVVVLLPNEISIIDERDDWILVQSETRTSSDKSVKQVIQQYAKGCTISILEGPRNTVFLSDSHTYNYPGFTCEEAKEEVLKPQKEEEVE